MIDAHAHLHEIEDVPAALQRARAAGVTGIVAVGMDLSSNRQTLALSQRFPDQVYPAIGYHPWSIKPEEVEENLNFLRDHLARCVALGEVGLDYQAKVKKKIQQEVLARVLEMAAAHGKPVILHTRFSQERTHRMVREAGIRRAVFHWYSGPLDLLERILADGYLVSATPALNYSPPHQAAIRMAPLEQILMETDAPVAYGEKPSEPGDLIITAQEISRLKSLELQEVQAVTTSTTRNFLGLL